MMPSTPITKKAGIIPPTEESPTPTLSLNRSHYPLFFKNDRAPAGPSLTNAHSTNPKRHGPFPHLSIVALAPCVHPQPMPPESNAATSDRRIFRALQNKETTFENEGD